MDRVKIFAEWITKKLFPGFIAIFGLIYIWWFLLAPGSRYTPYANHRHYDYGLILLGLFGASSIFSVRLKKSGDGSVLLRLTAILFFVILSRYTALNIPRIDDAVFNKNTLYFVAHFVEGECSCLVSYPIYEFTRWDWFFKYDTSEIAVSLFSKGSIAASPWFGNRVYLRYDKKTQQMNVVDVGAEGGEDLVYTYSVPPRYWIPETVDWHLDENLNFISEDAARLKEKRYYMSSECKVDSGHTNCESWTYMLYQCAADNTSCIPFPFQYKQEKQFYGFGVKENNAVNDLNVNVFADAGAQGKILIYTYGARPRCYVAECKILKSTK